MPSYSLVVFIEGRTNKANSCSYMAGFASAEVAAAALDSIKAGLPGVDVHGTVLGSDQGEYWAAQAAAGAIDLTDVETLLQDIRSNTANINSTGLTNTELRTTPVPVSGTVAATGPLTDTQLRATAVPVSGTFYPATQPVSGSVTASVSNFPATQPVSGTVTATGPLTDTQLRASAVPVSGTVAVSNFPATQPISGTVTATGPLTDTQLRAVAVPVSGTFYQATQPVSGTVAVSNFPATQPVSGTVTATGPLTDTQLRAVAVPVSVANFPVSQAVTGTFFQSTQPVSVAATLTVNQAAGSALSIGSSSGKTVVMKTGTSLVTSAITPNQIILTYTVTAGKTFYLEYADVLVRLTTFAATATNFGFATLQIPSSVNLCNAMLAGTGISQLYSLTLSEPMPFAAGTVIQWVCTPGSATSMTWQANFGGYEK